MTKYTTVSSWLTFDSLETNAITIRVVRDNAMMEKIEYNSEVLMTTDLKIDDWFNWENNE